jgi:hypothetical protein
MKHFRISEMDVYADSYANALRLADLAQDGDVKLISDYENGQYVARFYNEQIDGHIRNLKAAK